MKRLLLAFLAISFIDNCLAQKDSEMVIYLVKKKYGYSNPAGKVIIEPKFEAASTFSDGMAFVRIKKNWAVINKKGEFVVQPIYQELYEEGNGLLHAVKDKKHGFIDYTGKVVIPFQYDYALGFEHGLAAVKKDEKYGYINKEGKEVLPIEYGYPQKFKNGLSRISKDGKHGYIDTLGTIVIPCNYTDGWSFKNPNATRVQKNGKEIYLSSAGKEIIPSVSYSQISFHEKGKVGYVKNEKKKRALIDLEGNLITGFDYQMTSAPSEGYISAKKDGKWGVIDENGKTVIPFRYSRIGSFHEGLVDVYSSAMVNWGYLDAHGAPVIPFHFSYTTKFVGGRAFVKKKASGDKIALIDKTGKELTEYIYEFPKYYSKGYFEGERAWVQKKGKWGMIDKEGKEHGAFMYDKRILLKTGYYKVGVRPSKDSKGKPGKGGHNGMLWGVVDLFGSEIVKPVYYDVLSEEMGYFLVRDLESDFYYSINKDGKAYKAE